MNVFFNIADMPNMFNSLLKILPENVQQMVRNKYYEVKISKASLQDEDDLLIFQRIMKPGQVAIDVGANFGIYTKFFSAFVGPSGKVISFEPILKTYKSLVRNIKYLKLQNVEIHNVAVSDKIGEASMIVPEYDHGGENFYEAKIVENAKTGEIVKTNTLDEILKSIEHIHFLKIDVEGHEMGVLKGALTTLKKHEPFMLIEINGGIRKENENANNILQFLSELKYQPYKRIGNDLVKIVNDDEGFNYFFLTAAHVKQFDSIIKGS